MGVPVGSAVDETVWKTTVDELVAIFRDALIAVLLSLRRAQIRWDDLHAYDDWDAISETLFKAIVADSLLWAVGDLETTVPKYGFNMVGDPRMSFVRVTTTDPTGADCDYLVFCDIDPSDDRFDRVRCWMIDDRGQHVAGHLLSVPLQNARFSFLHRIEPGGAFREHTELAVVL